MTVPSTATRARSRSGGRRCASGTETCFWRWARRMRPGTTASPRPPRSARRPRRVADRTAARDWPDPSKAPRRLPQSHRRGAAAVPKARCAIVMASTGRVRGGRAGAVRVVRWSVVVKPSGGTTAGRGDSPAPPRGSSFLPRPRLLCRHAATASASFAACRAPIEPAGRDQRGVAGRAFPDAAVTRTRAPMGRRC